MLDEIPDLTPTDRALLHRFRVDQSPEPAIASRVLRSIAAQLETQPIPVERPWWLWVRAGAMSVAIAASALLVLGGTARVVSRISTPVPTEAVDQRAVDHRAGEAVIDPGTEPSRDRGALSPVIPSDPVPAPIDAAAIDAARDAAVEPAPEPSPSNLDTPRSRGARPPRTSTTAAAKPVDAAAEIASFRSIKLERSAKTRLESIQRHRREFASGAFVQEVAVLEIEAMCELGRTVEAADRSAAFGRAFGDSAYAGIARRGCAEASR